MTAAQIRAATPRAQRREVPGIGVFTCIEDAAHTARAVTAIRRRWRVERTAHLVGEAA